MTAKRLRELKGPGWCRVKLAPANKSKTEFQWYLPDIVKHTWSGRFGKDYIQPMRIYEVSYNGC